MLYLEGKIKDKFSHLFYSVITVFTYDFYIAFSLDEKDCCINTNATQRSFLKSTKLLLLLGQELLIEHCTWTGFPKTTPVNYVHLLQSPRLLHHDYGPGQL